MKKQILALCLMFMMPMMIFSQSYGSLWKQVADAENKDLPQTEQQVLRQIVQKAAKEKNYGQLLKASLQRARSVCTVSPDSLAPMVGELRQRQQEAAGDAVLHALYSTVLGYIYKENPSLGDDSRVLSARYYAEAMAHPGQLAAVKAADYEPFVKTGDGSRRFFAGDLLSLVGRVTGDYATLRDYYVGAGRRTAAMLASLWVIESDKPDEEEPYDGSPYLARLDSLITAYADLEEVGEAVIARYEFMDYMTDATKQQKWEYIEDALRRWGAWPRMNSLRNRRSALGARSFEAVFSELSIPQCEQRVELNNLSGVNSLTMRIYRVDAQGDIDLWPGNAESYKKLKPRLTALPQHTKTRIFAFHQPYELFTDSLMLDPLPAGVYMVEMETAPATDISRQFYYVSDVRVLSMPLPEKRMRYVAVNATTGQPLGGAKIRLATGYGQRRKHTTLTADAQGEAVYTYATDRPNEVFVYTANDKACPPANAYGNYYYHDNRGTQLSVAIYTDRSIYRPGQKVHVAAIVYNTTNGKEHEAQAGRLVTLRLRDANYQQVAETQVTTDKYGTCAADFTLPQQGLTGNYTVQVENRSHSIRVEEYKRPAFEVEMPAVTTDYRDGDTVTVSGVARSYAGVPVAGARVLYKVERRRAFWWMSYSRYWDGGIIGRESADEQLLSGEAVTDGDGRFTVDVPLRLPRTRYTMFYNFVVTADVTDQAGETHQGSLSLPLGNRLTALSTTLPDKVLSERLPAVVFHLRNAAGNDVEATVRYRIDGKRWHEAQTNSQVSPLTSQLSPLKSGPHTLEATCAGDTLRQDFVVFSLRDKRPATETDEWFYLSDTQFPRDGQPVTLQVGSSAKDMHIVYAVFSGNTVIESGAVEKSNALINRQFTYDESYGDGLCLAFAWVKDGRAHRYNATIGRPLPDKHLTLKWATFRDRLTPGQQEEWTLSVVKPDGTPADAQLMATLYDKSLDQLSRLDWMLAPQQSLSLPHTAWQYGGRGQTACTGSFQEKSLSVPDLSLSTLDYSVFPTQRYFAGHRRFMYKALGMANVLEAAPEVEAVADDAGSLMEIKVRGAVPQKQAMVYGAVARSTADAMDLEEAMEEEQDEALEADQPVQMRENLSENAFFYPQLVADEEGRVVLRFTLPESLTTWRFLGLAHTTDMMHGLLTGETVARKEVMIQPNMPRFVRQGDKATLSARIFNTGERAISGTARLQLLDPESESVVLQTAIPVSLEAGATTSVTFDCAPEEAWPSLLIAKVSVSGPDFSDGEQHYLPVLPSSERVTVSVPFTQNGPGTKEIDLTPLTSHPSTLTVEYTNNPAWLMIQALPTVGHPHDDCAICQASSLYANSIGRHILAQNPTAKHVFELWKREEQDAAASASPGTLHSSLEKNQELKELLLSNTPWVLDANHEDEQRQRLADFFDESLMSQRLSSAVDKLGQLQQPDGSWSWWPGMRGSFYITVEVSEMLARLQHMVGTSHLSPLTAQLTKAFDFMGKEIVELVSEMKKEEKRGHKPSFPSHKALQWLYICAIDGRPLPADVRQANAYLTTLLKKETKNQTLYEKALSAIVLNNKTYVRSLKEYTVYTEEMGRYYDTPRAAYSWRDYRIPTQVAAIEAMKRLTPQDTLTIAEMQRWLLQEKRTVGWDTPINSVDAIYAFLDGNAQTLAPQAQTVLRIDGQPLATSDATAAIGYVKTTLPADGARTFTAEKTSSGTSWGAVYAQFTQPTADIRDQKSGISVRREVPSGLRVGQRVTVRITIVADRDYDFVQVIDKRAACLEPVNQLSGYNFAGGYYCTPRDATTNYYFDQLPKGRHIIETEYYVDRAGTYETGTCVAECAYAPEYRGLAKSRTIVVNVAKE